VSARVEKTDMTPVRIVCILAMARTGSSHLIHLLKGCPEFNVKSELFKKSVELKRQDKAAIQAASGGVADDQALIAWRRAHPAQTLDALLADGGGRTLFFKLFVGHLSRKQIKDELFSREDVRYVVLRRRPIDSFISSRKAQYYGVHGSVDTTRLKPTLEAEEFVHWAAKSRGWYDWIAEQLQTRRLAFLDIAYETQLEDAANDVALAAILDGLTALGLPKVALPKEIDSSERQDREPDYRARVANWAEFERQILSVPAHRELLQWAETAPGLPSPSSAASESASTGPSRPGNGAGTSSSQTDSREERRRLKRERRRAEKKSTRTAGKRGRGGTVQ
jgi:LPS sulfotransferase NodH